MSDPKHHPALSNGVYHNLSPSPQSIYIPYILVGPTCHRWYNSSPTFLVKIGSNTIFNTPMKGPSYMAYTPKELLNDIIRIPLEHYVNKLELLISKQYVISYTTSLNTYQNGISQFLRTCSIRY